MRACSAECERNVLAQVHFRLSGALRLAVGMLQRTAPLSIPPELLHLIACAISNQPLSIRAGVEFGLLSSLNDVVFSTATPPITRAEGLKVLRCCCSSAAPTNVRTTVLHDPVILNEFCLEINEGTFLSGKIPAFSFVAEYLALLKEMVFSDEGRVNVEDCTALVSSISYLLTLNEFVTLWSSCVEVLVGCSQIRKLKEHFTIPLLDGRRTTVSQLLRIARLGSDASCNCLAILFNLTVDSEESIRVLIAKEGGFEITASALKLSSNDTYIVRCLQLLSRLATTKEVQTLLMETCHYSLICQGIRDSCEHTIGTPYKIEICGHLINTLACLHSPSPDCRKVAIERDLVRHLVEIFPEPRHDLGVITPESVIQVPRDSVPVIMLGNAARCLMPYADDKDANYDIYLNRTLNGIERLVCAMATINDIRVRKNIAILLAKGCRMPVVRDRVSALRGIQMMVELQDKLI